MVKANHIEVYWLTEAVWFPYITSLDVEASRPDSVIMLWSVAIKTSSCDIEVSIMQSDCRSPDTSSWFWGSNIELTSPRENVIDERPIDEILAVVDWNARKIFEGRSDQIEIISISDNGWIRIEAWYDRIIVQTHLVGEHIRIAHRNREMYGVRYGRLEVIAL